MHKKTIDKRELNKISKKIDYYNDFIISLLCKIEKTYPGDDCMDNDDITNHFHWSLNEIVKQYKEENIFIDTKELAEYFHDYYISNYYRIEGAFNDVMSFWLDIFNYKTTIKNKNKINLLVSIYSLFDRAFNLTEKNLVNV
jgi:hypothetical protein